MLTKCFADDVKDVIFVAIHPGWVQTDMGNSKGRSAPVTVTDSAKGIAKVTSDITKEQSYSRLLTMEDIKKQRQYKKAPVNHCKGPPSTPSKEVNFSSNSENEKQREKYLTAKYGAHQMALIRKRLKVEMWMFDQLQILCQSEVPATFIL